MHSAGPDQTVPLKPVFIQFCHGMVIFAYGSYTPASNRIAWLIFKEASAIGRESAPAATGLSRLPDRHPTFCSIALVAATNHLLHTECVLQVARHLDLHAASGMLAAAGMQHAPVPHCPKLTRVHMSHISSRHREHGLDHCGQRVAQLPAHLPVVEKLSGCLTALQLIVVACAAR
jgi:hypothetical protein